MYLYLYLYLNQSWTKYFICICIWKIQIFVFVFVFVFDKTYLTPALMGRNWSRIDSILWALPWFCPSYGMFCILIQISLNLAPDGPITLGPHEAGIWVKHPSLTFPAPSRGAPSRHLGSSYQQGVPILSPLIADLSGLLGASMQVMHGRPQGLFPRWPGG